MSRGVAFAPLAVARAPSSLVTRRAMFPLTGMIGREREADLRLPRYPIGVTVIRWHRLLLALFPGALCAQASLETAGANATSYLERYHEILDLAPLPERVASVHHLVLERDAGRLTLEQGQLYLLSPIGGRTIGAVFRGTGQFSFVPSIPAEQGELQGFANAPSLDDTVSEAILLFADSTLDVLRSLVFTSAVVPGNIADHVHDFVGKLKGAKDGAFDRGVMEALLNGSPSGFFLARLERTHGDPVLFEIDPGLSEAVRLLRPVGRRRWGTNWAVVTQFPLRRPLPATPRTWMYRERLAVPHYVLNVVLSPTSDANLDFTAQATLSLTAREAVGPWLSFDLHPKLTVDSAHWADGRLAPFFKAKDGDDLWVRTPGRLQAGDSLSLILFYHGDHGGLIDRYGSWFYIDPNAAWYPTNQQGSDLATFDLAYHTPTTYPLASVGDQTDSTVSGRVLTTHWVTRRPTPYATFNVGLFENYHVQQQDAPPLDVLLSEEAHRALRRELASAGIMIPEQRHMRENVAADVSNSLKLYGRLFGDCLYDHFYITEIPYSEGVSFPGMIDLSWSTFQNTSLDGFDEFFRAHEVAHQWWGIGVQPGSYRDAWLSEGLASFSALWYLQTARKRNKEYFKFLDQYQADIRDDRDDTGPIWIGYRNATPDARHGYDVMIYEKGAWVFHMLRILMLDLKTMREDRFTETMRDFYETYRGRSATTADFQGVVERHAGIPMDWFFDEWVKGTDVPAYTVKWDTQRSPSGYRVHLHVTQEHASADFQTFVLVSVDLGSNHSAHFRMRVSGPQTDFVSPVLPTEPKGLTFNDLHSVLADVKVDH